LVERSRLVQLSNCGRNGERIHDQDGRQDETDPAGEFHE
jgi:hypothetical protein